MIARPTKARIENQATNTPIEKSFGENDWHETLTPGKRLNGLPLVKYPFADQNASQRKASLEKRPLEGEDPSLRLPKEFAKGGWDFKCLARSETWSLYEKSKIYDEATGAMCTGFEVAKIRKRKKDRTLPSGKIIPKGQEFLPNSEEFGTDGFSYPTLGLAHAKFLTITQKEGAEL